MEANNIFQQGFKFIIELFFRDGSFNVSAIVVVLILVLVFVAYKLFKQLRKKQVVEQVSPLSRNDVIVRCKEIHQVAFYDGRDMHGHCETQQSYWLGSPNIKDYSQAYVALKHKGKDIKVGILSKDVKTVPLCLGDSPKDSNYFDKLELTQIARYFGFELRRDENANLCAKHNGYRLNLSVKAQHGMVFFFIYAIIGSKSSRGAYLYGVYEVVPTQRLVEKYEWLKA